jgi:hypothetical protein
MVNDYGQLTTPVTGTRGHRAGSQSGRECTATREQGVGDGGLPVSISYCTLASEEMSERRVTSISAVAGSGLM